MWSVLSKVGQLFGLAGSEPVVDVDAIAAVLDAEDPILGEEDEAVDANVNSNGSGVVCQHRAGVITDIYESHGFIRPSDAGDCNTQLYFKLEDAPSNIKVGHHVVYLTYKVSEDSEWVVRKILYVENEFWDKQDDCEEEDVFHSQPAVKEECETAYKHVIAKVTGRQGRVVLADQFQFCLDSVQVEFLPVEGDWLMLESLVQTEQEADTVLQVDRVTPVRARQCEGRVTHWNHHSLQGIVDSEILFSKDCCEPGYLPKEGDKVRLSCIESEQGQLTWRAVHVVPTVTKSLAQTTQYPKVLAGLLQNKHGIVISENTNCGTLTIGQVTDITIEVKNEGESTQTLNSVESSADESQIQLVEPTVLEPILICPQNTTVFTFKVTARFIGRSTELVVFKFEGFEIGRQVAMDVQVSSVASSMTEVRQRGSQRTKHQPITAQRLLATRNGFIVPGVRTIKPASFVPVHLGMFAIPDKLVNLVLGSGVTKKKEELIEELLESYRYLGEPCSGQNYMVRWDMIIHLEELEHVVNIARYNTNAALHRVEDYLSIEILGLSERRPSLIAGDRVVAREVWTSDNSWATENNSVGYEGYIHKVLSNEVLVKFSNEFHDTCHGVYSLSFEANRTKFRREHQAVHVAFRNLSADWLFPSRVSYKPPQIVITREENYVHRHQNVRLELQESADNAERKRSEENKSIRENSLEERSKTESFNRLVPSECDKQNNVNSPADLTFENCDSSIIDCRKVPNEDIQENKAEVCDDSVSSCKVVRDDNNVNELLNDTAKILNKEVTSPNLAEHLSKTKDPELEKLATIAVQQKSVSPRVPVIARFLQNGNSSSNNKSPKEVKNMLQQLASMSMSPNPPTTNCSIKTLEEIEKSLLRDSNNVDLLEGINNKRENCSTNEAQISPFEQFLNSSNLVHNINENVNKNLMMTGKENNCSTLNNVDSNKKEEKAFKNNLNESRYNKSKIPWNSNIEMKLGIEKIVDCRIPREKRRTVKWFNCHLNHYQKEAVRNILKGEARPLPYVIFGPPGTGKTITLVEAILQIYFLIPESRLLIATPSNSAADLICERLLASQLLRPGDLLRLVGFHYADQGRVPDWLRPYCGSADIKARDDQNEPLPQKEGVVNISRHAIGRHRITVGTCNALGVLYQMGFPRGHFTHVLVDEAGQATEPEILIPLAFLHNSYGQAVFAGDPLQLGPVVLSKIADYFGLGESLLSRLLLCAPYFRDPIGFPSSGGYNPHLVTRLVFNYRSLPEILCLPNNMFYNGDLIPKVSVETSEEARVLDSLREVLPPRPDSPPPALLFHGIRGTNCQSAESPSWHNPHEAVQAAIYLQGFYAAGLAPEECGIITPYQAQASKIREMLETLEMPLPKVGSVEEFQGQERMAVILSTVRSSPRLIESDLRHTVGFVASPRRLNVAITRARAALVIVGNPHLLARDQYWRSVLTYCVRHGAYTGCDRPPLEGDVCVSEAP